MKLNELREHTRDGRWEDADGLHWRLDMSSLRELLADINRELDEERTKGYLQGAREMQEKIWIGENSPRQPELNDPRQTTDAQRAEYWRGRKDGIDETRKATGAPADSELGIELSKIRDRLNALETCSDNEVQAWKNMEGLFDRVSSLENSTVANKAFEGIGKRFDHLFSRVAALETQVPPVHPSVRDRLDIQSDALAQVESKLHNRVLALENVGALRRIEYLELQDRNTIAVFEEHLARMNVLHERMDAHHKRITAAEQPQLTNSYQDKLLVERLQKLEARAQVEDCAAVPLSVAAIENRLTVLEASIRLGVASDDEQDKRLGALESYRNDIADVFRAALDRLAKQS